MKLTPRQLGLASAKARAKKGKKKFSADMKALRAKVKHPHIGKQDTKTGRWVKA
jgi:hypothetical protein